MLAWIDHHERVSFCSTGSVGANPSVSYVELMDKSRVLQGPAVPCSCRTPSVIGNAKAYWGRGMEG